MSLHRQHMDPIVASQAQEAKKKEGMIVTPGSLAEFSVAGGGGPGDVGTTMLFQTIRPRPLIGSHASQPHLSISKNGRSPSIHPEYGSRRPPLQRARCSSSSYDRHSDVSSTMSFPKHLQTRSESDPMWAHDPYPRCETGNDQDAGPDGAHACLLTSGRAVSRERRSMIYDHDEYSEQVSVEQASFDSPLDKSVNIEKRSSPNRHVQCQWCIGGHESHSRSESPYTERAVAKYGDFPCPPAWH